MRVPGRVRVLSSALVAVLVLAVTSVFLVSLFRIDVTVQVDGKTIEVKSFKSKVRDVLAVAGVEIAPEDVVSPGLNRELKDGMTCVVTRAFPVTVAVGDTTTSILVVGGTVSRLLKSAGIEVRSKDKVFPALDAKVRPNSLVRVMRVDETLVTKTVPIAHATRRQASPNIDKGKSTVVSQGRDGLLQKTYKVKIVDGKAVSRTLVSSKKLREPVAKVVSYGVRVPFSTLTTSRGTYTYSRVMSLEATAYCGGGRATSAGMRSGYGVVAVDPRVIPMGTKLYVEGYGIAVAGDVGGAIKGSRIDLGYESRRDAIHFGRRQVRVYLLKK